MNIYQSIAEVMKESIAIGKEKKNLEQGFMYRGIDDVMNTFYPLLSKHKIFIVPEVLEREREERLTDKQKRLIYSILKIKYTFYAEDGSNISAVVVGEGMDRADKSSNKAMSIAFKYAMFQVFCIPTEEMPDSDSNTPEQSKKIEQPQTDGKPYPEVNSLLPPLSVDEAFNTVMIDKSGKEVKLGTLSAEQLKWIAENSKGAYQEAAKILIDVKVSEVQQAVENA